MSHLIDDLLAPNVGRKLVLVDACRDQPKDPGRGSKGIQGRVIALPEDTAILFSCRAGQQSFENEELKHGVFTHCVLEALRGAGANKGTIDWTGVVTHVNRRMASDEILKLLPEDRLQTPIPAGGVAYTRLGRLVALVTPPPAKRGKTITNSIGMQLVRIPAGEFRMGSGKSVEEIVRRFSLKDEDAKYYKDEHPQHRVKITKDFYLQTTEVTQGQWKAIMQTQLWKGKDYTKEGRDYAATYVSWDDAVEFCRKLSSKEGKRYRLPSEAEWEYACRTGSRTMFSFGDDVSKLGEYAWYHENAWDVGEKYAHRVGLKKRNAFGLFDMHGNVYEWCSDWYDEDYYGQSPAADPKGASSGSSRVLRGGSWRRNLQGVRSAGRLRSVPGYRYYDIGFRVCLSSE